jgi:hypothetical protein
MTKFLREFPYSLQVEVEIVLNNAEPRPMLVCSLLNDAVSSSQYIPSNKMMINEL